MKPVTWKEFQRVCEHLGCQVSRIKGDHIVMTRPGMVRPVVFKKVKDLGPDIIHSNLRTLGITKGHFEKLLEIARGGRN